MKKTLIVFGLAALLGVVPASAQVDFSRYVALGDSVTAGFVSGGLVQYYQDMSYPALLAQQAGAPAFEMPTITEPGFPPLYELTSLSPLVLGPPAAAPGLPSNALYPLPYNNLGVPGTTVYDMLFTTGNIENLLAGNIDNPMNDLILRIPQIQDPATGAVIPFTAITQAIALDPTFASMWIGNNDVLPAAISATYIDGVTVTPVAVFQELYGQALGAMATMTSADIVVINIPNVTAIPFVTTLPNTVEVPGYGTVQLMGEDGPIGADDFITLGASELLAQGYGLPGFPPLPEDLNPITFQYGVVLRAEEAEAINAHIAAFNQIIDQTAAAFGVPVLDINSLYDNIVAGDPWILGGITLTSDFLTGGIFSYDGVHPQNIGHGLVTTELIDLINESYGGTIPQLNMEQLLCSGGCSGRGVPIGTKAEDVIFSKDAFERLKEIFPIEKPRARMAPNRGAPRAAR